MNVQQRSTGVLLFNSALFVAGSGLPRDVVAAPEVREAPKSDSSAGEGVLQEIVVTAEKRTQSARDVPAPVTAIPEQALRSAAIDTVKLLAAATTGVSISAQSSSVVPYIRGIGTQF